MLWKRIAVVGIGVLLICAVVGWIVISALYVNKGLIGNADAFMRDLQSGDRKSAYIGVSTEMQDAMSKAQFVEQFYSKKIKDWHFETANLLTGMITGNMTVNGNQYHIALKLIGTDTGQEFGGYDFGEFGRGGIPIS
ncbi:MAG: hypothetical protein ABI970_13605 [Chloroflexota bacterium]